LNILHLRYAIEIAKTNSLSKAADNLYMAQPNLSRAIKELEENFNITIFNRTSRGMFVTQDGEEFLKYARKILEQIDEVKNIYNKKKCNKQVFSISVPPSEYISYAFSQFVNKLSKNPPIELNYTETNSQNTIDNILNFNYNLGIIRYDITQEKYFKDKLTEKELSHRTIAEFPYMLTVSENHKLARDKKIEANTLKNHIEIINLNFFISNKKKEELSNYTDQKIFVSEQYIQLEFLKKISGTFTFLPSLSKELLTRYKLIQKPCEIDNKTYKDVLIYKNSYQLNKLDNLFISELRKHLSLILIQ